jgi:hypothetical protein
LSSASDTLECWRLLDRAVVTQLREQGWRVRRLRLLKQRALMNWEASKGPWLFHAPDVAKLWDIAQELNEANPAAGRFKRYLAKQPSLDVGSFVR